MRIVVDLQGLQSNHSKLRGIGRYCSSLMRALVTYAPQHEFIIVLNRCLETSMTQIRPHFADLPATLRYVEFTCLDSIAEAVYDHAWRQFSAKLLREKFILDLQPDVVVIGSLFEGARDDAVSSIGLFRYKLPTAVVFYDLIPYINPDQFLADALEKRFYYARIESLQQADLLLAISESAKQEAIQHLGINAAKIAVISSAADALGSSFAVLHQQGGVELLRLGITRPYLMHVSAYEPRKNFAGLIRAYAMLDQALRKDYQLVLVCKLSAKQYQELHTLACEHGLQEGELVLTNYVEDQLLTMLYAHCHLFVFPSLHEGFGLPALEAMQFGVATIGANTTSIPEVIGRQDATFDPHVEEEISARITRVLTDTAFWQELKDHAIVQAKKFSWERCAQHAMSALEALVQAHPAQHQPWQVRHAALIAQLAELASQHSPDDIDLQRLASCVDQNEKAARLALSTLAYADTFRWYLEGPFDSSYSLALLNRETARALSALSHQVALNATDGPGDFIPDAQFLREHTDIAAMYAARHSLGAGVADVCSRNLYPPRVEDMTGILCMLHHYAWEESGFVQDWADAFNQHLDGLTTLSTHVQKILQDHGVTVPIRVSGCGADHWQRIQPVSNYRLAAKTFRFLHVSSCFPRKGVWHLLNAYGQAFNANDDVSLIIKTFSNPHNEIEQMLNVCRQTQLDYPQVILLKQELDEATLKALYESCHVLVAPSYAEGFGLPMAEAMLSGLPVITTAWGGQLEFCDTDNAWLVDYQFARAQTHFKLFDSAWAEPDLQALKQAMLEAYHTSTETRQAMAEAGRAKLLARFRWRDVALRSVEFARFLYTYTPAPEPTIAWITTYNTRCGIAMYAQHLLCHWPQQKVQILAAHTQTSCEPDPANCYRLWQTGKTDNGLENLASHLQTHAVDVLVLQFNHGLFDFQALAHFIMSQSALGRKIIMIMHATQDPYGVTPNWQLIELREALTRCARILVHGIADLNRLKNLGIVDNVSLFPHGMVEVTLAQRKIKPRKKNTMMLASYGFCLPHKGLMELVKAMAVLQKDQPHRVRLLLLNALYPTEASAQLAEELKQRIQSLGLQKIITLDTRFHSLQQSLNRLRQADLLVFAYQHTTESSSAAVRDGMASERPIAVTPLEIFEDLGDSVFTLPGSDAKSLAMGIKTILDELAAKGEKANAVAEQARLWREQHSYMRLSQRLYNLCKALCLRTSQP